MVFFCCCLVWCLLFGKWFPTGPAKRSDRNRTEKTFGTHKKNPNPFPVGSGSLGYRTEDWNLSDTSFEDFLVINDHGRSLVKGCKCCILSPPSEFVLFGDIWVILWKSATLLEIENVCSRKRDTWCNTFWKLFWELSAQTLFLPKDQTALLRGKNATSFYLIVVTQTLQRMCFYMVFFSAFNVLFPYKTWSSTSCRCLCGSVFQLQLSHFVTEPGAVNAYVRRFL